MSMNEAETRAEIIDPQLKEAGWGVDGSRVRREYLISGGKINADSTRDKNTRLIADYVLEHDGVPLAVMEAKKSSLSIHDGVTQAKLYAEKLGLRTAFATNGREFYHIDMESGVETPTDRIPTPEELTSGSFIRQNDMLTRLNKVPFARGGKKQTVRYYQEIAVNKVMEAVAENKPRILLNLATGTGKTFIAFQIAWKLFQARWNLNKDGKQQPRILFLADRNTLANQAFNGFSGFPADALVRISPKEIRKNGEVPKNGSVFFTIFQTFTSGKEDAPNFGQYGRDFFDFIIIDECHRAGARDNSAWRDILEYFKPAVQLGLTATPRHDVTRDTYNYFGEPVFTYSLKGGMNDGFLTPFRVKQFTTSLDTYEYASDDDVLGGDIDHERLYKENDFNKKIEIEARERKRVRLMLTHMGDPRERTIVFCANQAHAALVCDIIKQETTDKRAGYCVRITSNDGAIGDNNLKRFQDDEKPTPIIVTTSQKLTTGVDVPSLRNVVLMRPIGNMVEFKQIIGRGTRLADNKGYFTIMDFTNASTKFEDPEWDGDPQIPTVIIHGDDNEDDGGLDNPPPDAPDGDGDGGDGGNPDTPKPPSEMPEKITIKLSDNKEREIRSSVKTTFMHEGGFITPQEYIKWVHKLLKPPDFFKTEDELRIIWSNPTTRTELLKKLDEKGCTNDNLQELQKLVGDGNSDIFDVLDYIAYAPHPPISRAERVAATQNNIYAMLSEPQREFIQFVLDNYIKEGIDELDISKLSTVLEAKYGSLKSAQESLGDVDSIKTLFTNFQKHLYEQAVA